MEQFAIWNLLKTMLNNSPSPSSQAAKTAELQTESVPSATKFTAANNDVNASANSAISSGQESKETPPTPSAKACEEYLLRHERLTNSRKR